MKALEVAFRLHDPGAEEVTMELSEKLKCIACLCAFSKVVIDSNSSLLSAKLYNDFEKSEFATGLFNPYERTSLYYGLYHEIMREVIHWIEPKYHISIHTKPIIDKNDKSLLEVVYKGESSGLLATKMTEELNKKTIKATCKEDAEFDLGVNRSVELALHPTSSIKSFRINVKEDVARSEIRRMTLINVLSTSINKLFTY